WTDSVIWDENNRPTTTNKETTVSAVDTEATATQTLSPLFVDPSKFMLTLPYEPVNLPLEPDENNAVMGRVSLYESYLQNMANPKTTTTQDPLVKEQAKMNQAKMEWFQKYGKAMLMMPQQYIQKNFDHLGTCIKINFVDLTLIQEVNDRYVLRLLRATKNK
ncbi:Astryp1, partial [Operophtera brumata]